MRFKIKIINYIVFFSLISISAFTQNYQEEIGFTFVKAKYLLDTERYDDAVREFNRVINENPSHEDALAMRALAKYRLSAYLGTKKDILKFIELKGITPEAIGLLAKAEYHLNEMDAAFNSLNTALMISKTDSELYEFRAAIHMDRDMTLQACEDWRSAAMLGSGRAEQSLRQNCRFMSSTTDRTQPPVQFPPVTNEDNPPVTITPSEHAQMGEVTKAQDPGQREENTGSDTTATQNTHPEEANGTIPSDYVPEDYFFIEEEKIDPRLLDNSIHQIVVDEDLTLVITGQGLGSRPIIKQPNILMLSESDGEVVIDVCISRGGRVISHSFNQEASSLNRKSLVSLALRKATEFWFDKSDLMEQCGQIIFKIKGA